MARIAVIGAGAMGSGIGARLAKGGADVPTDLDGRSAATRQRAAAAGMTAASLADILSADIILSIVPPAEAVGVAQKIAAEAARLAVGTLFIDCNAVSPATMAAVADAFSATRMQVLDGCIIGGPPKGDDLPRLYVSGHGAERSGPLTAHGLAVRVIDGGIGAASALKMCYAGINKGFVGLGTAMMLAAIRNGADGSLRQELSESAPAQAQKLASGIPDMYAKAYRWVAEMEEIADFLGPDDPAALIFRGMAGLYARMAQDREAGGILAEQLDALLASG